LITSEVGQSFPHHKLKNLYMCHETGKIIFGLLKMKRSNKETSITGRASYAEGPNILFRQASCIVKSFRFRRSFISSPLSGRLKFTVRRHKFNKDSLFRQLRAYHSVECKAFAPPKPGCYVTKLAPHKALRSIVRCKLTLIKWSKSTVYIHRGTSFCPSQGQSKRLYRGTSLTRKRTPLGPYRRPMPRVLGGS